MLIVALIIGFIFIRNIEVLRISGLTQSNDNQMVILELENGGFSDIQLLSVTTNDTREPYKSELG